MTPSINLVIPLYRANLSQDELIALRNNLKCLENYSVTFVKPQGLDLTNITKEFSRVEEFEVSPLWLGKERGIYGYNDMMLSAEFYEHFLKYDYILICHVDAWVFRDELDKWTAKGYDHVAAPWPLRTQYRHFPLKQIRQLRLWLKPRHKIIRWQRFGCIGNGGFSLRRVAKFHEMCLKYTNDIAYFKAQENELYNEDLFWALIPQEMNIPTMQEALHFAFDVQPAFCYADAGNQLPMACHGFNKPDRINFWRRFIPNI